MKSREYEQIDLGSVSLSPCPDVYFDLVSSWLPLFCRSPTLLIFTKVLYGYTLPYRVSCHVYFDLDQWLSRPKHTIPDP